MRRVVKVEERNLWQTAMRGVRRLTGSNDLEEMSAAVESASPPEVTLEAKLSQAPPKNKSTLKPRNLALPRFLDSETDRRLKTRAGHIDARLDLHGMTEQAAHEALTSFIEDSMRTSRHVVLVITGKGRMGKGALKRNLPLWLEGSTLRDRIAAVQTAYPHHGGEGAVYVQLRRK